MNKSFLSNLALLIAINLIIKPIFIFGIDRNVQNLVGEHDYGMYFTFLTFCMIMQVVGDAGLQNYNNQQIASEARSFQDFFPGVMLGKALASVFYFILVLLGGLLLGYQTNYDLLVWIMIGQFFSGILLLLRTNISGSGYYKTDSLFSSMDRFFMIFLCGYFLWSPSRHAAFSIGLFAKLQVVSYIIVLIFVLIWIFAKLPIRHIKLPKIADLSILKKSMPYATVVLLMIVYSRCDIILLENLIPDGTLQAGIYAASYRLLDAMNMVGFLTGSLLLPMFARILVNKEETKQLYQLSFKVLLLFTTLVSVTVFIYRSQIMHLLYTNATEEWGNVLGVLMLTFTSMTLAYVSGCYLTASGKVNSLIKSFLIAIVINVGLNLILIPYFKVMGVAITSAITQLFILFIQIKRTQHYADVSFENKYLVRFLAFVLIFGVFSFIIEKIFVDMWYYLVIITPIFGLLLAVLFKILPDEILLAIKKRNFLNLR